MREAIRDNFNSQLSSAADLKVYSKEYIDFLVQKGPATEIEVANQLGVAKMVSGSFLAVANTLRIEAHVVDVRSGVLEASDRVEGAQSEFFELQRQLALRIMARLNIPAPPEETGRASTPATAAPSLDAYKLLLEAEGETATAGPKKGEDPYSEGVLRKEADKLSGHSLQWMRTSRAWAQEAPQQQPASEEEIQQVLEMYRQAYEKKDLDLLENVYAALTPIQREANVKYFQNTRGITQRCGNKGQAVYLLG
jgi:TolB-like protein